MNENLNRVWQSKKGKKLKDQEIVLYDTETFYGA